MTSSTCTRPAPLAALSVAWTLSLSVLLSACGGGYGIESEASAPAPSPVAPAPGTPGPAAIPSGTFTTQQRPANWIGQSNEMGEDFGMTGSTFTNARGVAVAPDGKVYVSDQTNQRVLVFASTPTVDGATASFALGATDLNTQGSLKGASGLSTRGGKLALALISTHQVAIYNAAPQTPDTPPSLVLGQANTSGCSATQFNFPSTPFLSPDGKLLVADRSNHRVLIWNSVPTTTGTAPNLVLGQSGLSMCAANDDAQTGNSNALPSARTFNAPNGIWTDGTRLAIVDTNNSRVLIWNTFPTTSFQSADIVLGQAGFTTADGSTSASGLSIPNQIDWNGKYLAVSDSLNNRVLLWDGFPTTSGAPASVVLGQPDFDTGTERTRDALTLTFPSFLSFDGTTLFVTETNNRVSIFKAAP